MPRSKQKLPLFLSSKEVETLLKNIKWERHTLGFHLMAYGGLRVSEMCALKLGDVNLARGFMKVHGKGGKERIVPLSSKLQRAIEHYLRGGGSHLVPESFLVGGSRRSWHDMIKKYARRNLGRGDVHCHTLRHSFATMLYDEGVQIERISQLLGHARLDTTMVYAHISLAHKKEAVGALDNPRMRFIRRFVRIRPPRSDLVVKSGSQVIGRDKERAELNGHLSRGVSVILIGPRGCGKSAILRHAECDGVPAVRIGEYKKKQTLIAIILSSQNIEDPGTYRQAARELKKLSIDELLEQMAGIGRLIVIDDITDTTRADRKVIARLAGKVLVAAASSRTADKKLFRTFLEVKPLKRHHTRIILSEMIHMNDTAKKERIVDDILHTAGDNLREAEYLARQLQLGKEPGEVATDERAANQSTIAPFLLIVVLFFVAFVLKSYATSLVAFSYALLVVFRLVFYKYLFSSAATSRKGV